MFEEYVYEVMWNDMKWRLCISHAFHLYIVELSYYFILLTHKQLDTHECVLSTVATDALVLKQQGISIHSADQIAIALDPFQKKI